MRASSLRRSLLAAALALAVAAPARAELRISDLAVFLNDHEVTVHVVLLGAVPEAFQEGIQSGIPAHVRVTVELWQYNRYWRDQLLMAKVVERTLVYNVVTKELKVTSLKGEARPVHITRDFRAARSQDDPRQRPRPQRGHLRPGRRRGGAQRREHLPRADGRHGRADLTPVRLPHDPAGAIVPLLSDENRRQRNLLIIAGFLFLVAVANRVDTGVYAPDLPLASNITIFALLNLNLIVLLLLVVLLFRNLVKLWFERRQNVIGAKFKTKLVLAFLSLSLAPAILIFLIASNFINKSIEGWFKPQVERPLDQALGVAQTYYNNLERTALRHAQRIGRVIDREGLLGEGRRKALATYLVEQQEQLGISAITVFNARG